MSGEILADGDSPMFMTVDQYNERVARTWNLAIAAEQERITKLLEDKAAVLENIETGNGYGSELNSIRTKTLSSVIALIKGESNE